jgi:hypothetical protein
MQELNLIALCSSSHSGQRPHPKLRVDSESKAEQHLASLRKLKQRYCTPQACCAYSKAM